MEVIDNSLLASVILGIMGLIISLIYSRRSHDLAHQQMQKQLFGDFNRRYRLLNDYLIEIELNYPSIEKLNSCERSSFLKQKVNDYFSLCAEEFYWYYHKKRIDKLVWASWQSGMNYWYRNVPAIRELWYKEIESNGKESYYITNGVEFFNDSKAIDN